MPRAALVGLLALAACPAAAAAPILEHIEVASGGDTVVRLRLSAPVVVRTEARAPASGRPDRLLVDLVGARLGPDARAGAAGRGPLLRVLADELGGPTVRLTLELLAPVPFVVESREREVRVVLGDDMAAPAPSSVPRVEQPRPGS